ncbi:WD repeat-containing protein 93 isoform X8 [Notamacropus eugenii]|uniref:WD repeat-containing protein 93 isoform X8 n=1 Tax=Notamacropus eugenii TaxID=9315 RepID=UPI003B67BC5D
MPPARPAFPSDLLHPGSSTDPARTEGAAVPRGAGDWMRSGPAGSGFLPRAGRAPSPPAGRGRGRREGPSPPRPPHLEPPATPEVVAAPRPSGLEPEVSVTAATAGSDAEKGEREASPRSRIRRLPRRRVSGWDAQAPRLRLPPRVPQVLFVSFIFTKNFFS